jgi:hypothetical protein
LGGGKWFGMSRPKIIYCDSGTGRETVNHWKW